MPAANCRFEATYEPMVSKEGVQVVGKLRCTTVFRSAGDAGIQVGQKGCVIHANDAQACTEGILELGNGPLKGVENAGPICRRSVVRKEQTRGSSVHVRRRPEG